MLFIVEVYYNIWFSIKAASHVTNGPHHVLKQMMLVNQSNQTLKDIVKPRVESTAWFAHPEHILLSLLASKEETERRFAVKIIREKIRKGGEGDTSVRVYKIPTIN